MPQKKVLVISSSPRRRGNSALLCEQFAKGATDAGNTVETVILADKTVGPCRACYACKRGTCPQKDDAPAILRQMQAADVIVFATPVYFYTMCAQLKALIDRSVAIFPDLKNKRYYFIMTMVDHAPEMFKGTVEALRGFLDCYEGSVEAGRLGATGVYEAGAVRDTPFWQEAYELGKGV